MWLTAGSDFDCEFQTVLTRSLCVCVCVCEALMIVPITCVYFMRLGPHVSL